MKYAKINEKFTYGFEIEGVFSYRLLEWLKKDGVKRKYHCDEKSDGSVDVAVPYDREDEFNHDDGLEELGIGIFRNLKDMLYVLRQFKNEDNYYWNSTCGVHVHVKPETPELKSKILDYKFIKHLQDWARDNLSEIVRQRIVNRNQYCMTYGNLNTTFYDMRAQSKYRFVRNHPQGTLEFRFFSACDDKAKDVELFFRELFRELKKIKQRKASSNYIYLVDESEINDNYVMKNEEAISEVFKMKPACEEIKDLYMIEKDGRSPLECRVARSNQRNQPYPYPYISGVDF